MHRRNILKSLAALPLAIIGGRGVLAQPGKAQGVDVAALQADWKALLASNADVAKSAEPLTLPNAEWKKRLSAAAYDVLREEGTEPPGSSPLNRRKAPRRVCVRRLQSSAVHLGDEIRKRHRLAQLFTTIPGALATKTDFKLILPAHRISLRALRRAPWPPVRRWPAADPAALLQQRRRAALHSEDGLRSYGCLPYNHRLLHGRPGAAQWNSM